MTPRCGLETSAGVIAISLPERFTVKSGDVDFAPVAEAFGFRTATIRSIDDLRRSTRLLQKPDGPVLLDCKINASVVAPFLAEVVKHQKGEA